MSTVLERVPCPRCRSNGRDRSGDNLIRYIEGSSKCYACGYYEGNPNNIKDLRKRLQLEPVKYVGEVEYPDDITKDIDPVALSWMMSYNITLDDIDRYKIMWSEGLQYLIFSCYTAGILRFWQGRNFGDGPKYYTCGDASSHITVLSNQHDPSIVVTCEDYISTIRVSKVVDATPMWGGMITKKSAIRLARYYDRLVLWGDFDKAKDNVKLARRYEQYFKNGCTSIITKEDPKCYSTSEIKEYIDEKR